MAAKKYLIDIDSPLGDWYASKRTVKAILANHPNEDVSARINSPGGSLDHGLDIAQQFKDHGNVIAYVFGLTASAATVAALGAKKIVMSRNSFILIHRCSNWVDVWGQMNEEQIEKAIEELTANKEDNKKIDLVLSRMYADKCKKSIQDIHDIMKKSAWLSADEAKSLGFADEIIEDNEPVKFTNSMADKFNSLQMPLPPIAPMQEDENTTGERLANVIVEKLASLFKKNDKITDNTNQQTNAQMKKLMQFVCLNALLGIEGIEFNDEAKVASFNEEQLKAINEKLDALQKEVDNKVAEITKKDEEILSKTNEIAAKETEISTLKNSAGDDDNRIHNDGDIANDADVVKNAREMFKQFNPE